MDIYKPLYQITTWENGFNSYGSTNMGNSDKVEVDTSPDEKAEYVNCQAMSHLVNCPEGNNSADKVQRRLEQNREAARKSRQRKKAYVQHLETSRLKLAQLEQELMRIQRQGLYTCNGMDSGSYGTINPVIAAFEMEYVIWIGEQQKQESGLRNALQAQATDLELQCLVDSALNHYYNLFHMKSDAAKGDVFYLLSGTWRTPAERFFLWIGGFRPSQLLNVLTPHFGPLTEEQVLHISNLRQSCQEAEYALSQGIDKLHQAILQSVSADTLSSGSFVSQMADAMEKFETLEHFVSQADHLRQQTLQRMSHILLTQQAARGLLALGEYFHRLRALSSLWTSCPREPSS